MSKSILRRFSASALCVLLARVLAFVALFGFNAVLARCLKPADFGLFALLFSFATLASLLASCGMNRALVKVLAGETSLDPNTVRKVVNMGLVTSIVAGMIVGTLGFLLCSQFLPVTDLVSRVTIACLFGGIVLVRNVHFVLAETTRGFHETNWSNLFGGPAGGPLPHMVFLLSLLGAWFTLESLSLTTVLLIYFGCFIVTLPPLVKKLYSLNIDDAHWKTTETSALQNNDKKNGTTVPSKQESEFSAQSIWLLAVPLMLTQSFGLTLSQADIWMAGAMVLPASIAVYCAAQRMLGFLTIPLQISGTAIVSFIPELIAKKQVKQLQEMVGIATFASGAIGLTIGIVLVLFSGTVLSVVFGSYYVQAAPILQILIAGQLICVLTGPCEVVLMMAGHQNKTLIVNVLSAIALFTLGPLGIYLYGITGLAVAMSAVTIGQNVSNWWMAKQLVGVSTHFDVTYAARLINQVQKRFLIKKDQLNAA